jgi:tetratricopeptide (TPR) repeat protein
MRRLKALTPLVRPAMAAAVCLVAALPIRADEAGKDYPAVAHPSEALESALAAVRAAQAPTPLQIAPAPAPVERPVLSDPLEQELERESSKLEKMEAELRAVESLPLPSAEVPAVKAPPAVVKPPPSPNEIPKGPVKGLEEEYANTLYALGKYDLARAAYERLIESEPQADVLVWARLQVANCDRHLGDLQAAGAAYEALMNAAPASPWAGEAAWWAGEVKWWILWGQSTQ